MTRPKAAELAFTGINADQIPSIVPADWWTGGRNVYFKAGKTCRTQGEGPFAETGRLYAAQFIFYVDVGAQQYWIYGGDAGIAATDGTLHWNITPAAGWTAITSKNKKYTAGDINGVPFVNHPDVGPFWWDADVTHRMTALPGWPAGWTCDVMRAHKNFLFAGALNTAAGPIENQVSWSSSASPGQIPAGWNPTPTNDAGDVSIGGPSGPIVDMLSVRDQLIVAKSAFTAVMQYVGGTYVFETRDLFPSTGLFATSAWIELGNKVYMITGSGHFIAHDLTTFEDQLYGILQDYFTKQLNWEYPSSCFAWRDNNEGQVYFAYPTGTSKACTEAISIEAQTGRPGIRDMPSAWSAGEGTTSIENMSWDQDPNAWNSDQTSWNEGGSGYKPTKVVFAASWLLEQGKADTQWIAGAPAAMQAYAVRKGIDGGDIEYRKFFAGITPRIRGQAGDVVTLQLSVRDSDDAPEIQTPKLSYVIGSGLNVDCEIDGRLAGIEVDSSGGSPWQLSSVIPQGRRSGRW